MLRSVPKLRILCNCSNSYLPVIGRKFTAAQTASKTNELYSLQFRRQFEQTVLRSQSFNFSPLLSQTWSCESCRKSNMRYILLCSKCQRIISPEQLESFTFFELLDQERTFDVDLTALSKHFRRLQGHLHPDKFANKEKVEEYHAQQVSSRINMAYQTISKPALRAAYLLELDGKPFEEKSIQMDGEFLMEIMETNEAISNCDNLQAAKEIMAANNQKLDKHYKEISAFFKENNLDAAMQCLGKLNYYENINEKLKDLLMNLS